MIWCDAKNACLQDQSLWRLDGLHLQNSVNYIQRCTLVEVLVLIIQQGQEITFWGYFLKGVRFYIGHASKAKNACLEDWPLLRLDGLNFCGIWFFDKKKHWSCKIRLGTNLANKALANLVTNLTKPSPVLDKTCARTRHYI